MNKLPSLYQITEEFVALEKILMLEQGELTPEYEALEKELEGLLMSKTDGYVEFYNRLEDEIEAIDKREKQLKAAKKGRKAAIERIKELAKAAMTKAGVKRCEGDIHQIILKRGAPTLDLFNPDQIPVQYIETETVSKIKRMEILRDLKNDKIVPGAAMVDAKEHISFGTKRVVKK